MKRAWILLAVFGFATLPASATSFYVSPDVPTDDPAAAAPVYLPWDIVRNNSGGYGLTLALPNGTPIDALHRMNGGDWLFSVETTTELPPGGGVFYEPRDVIGYDPVLGVYYAFFLGAANGVPLTSDVDAVFLDDGDSGDLIMSFDVPTSIGAATYMPADLVRFKAGVYGFFLNSATTVPPIPITSNVAGADQRPGPGQLLYVLTFDVPTTLGANTYLPGQLVAWDPAAGSFSNYYSDPNWPISSRADAMSFLATPGVIPPTIALAKVTLAPLTISVGWSVGCSVGGEDYGIYEGAITSPWTYNHVFRTCTDTGGNFTETLTPGAGIRYYLVVPNNPNDEGSYGKDRATTGVRSERPVGATVCRLTQELETCP